MKDRTSKVPWFSLSLGERVGVRAVAFFDLHWQPLFALSCPLEIARNLERPRTKDFRNVLHLIPFFCVKPLEQLLKA